jgi:DNA-binding NarL/FixJ family response regulator
MTAAGAPEGSAMTLSLNEHSNLQMNGSVVMSYPPNSFGSFTAVLPSPQEPDVSRSAIGTLPRRQHEVLILIMQGRSNKEIARSLNLSLGTVKIHLAALFAKFGVRRRAALAAVGVQSKK